MSEMTGQTGDKQRGGKSVFGATLGILMLEARFPRIPGDMGNALTWPFPVLYKVVRGASPDRVVRDRASGLDATFVEGARELVTMGADGITTNCGFLSLFQGAISEALGVPVATSALMQVPMIESTLPSGKRCGIITISRATLTDDHLTAAGVPLDTPITGTDGGREFTRVILGDEAEMDSELCRRDIVDAAVQLRDENPGVGAVVLECTNMVPYAADVRRATGLAVYSIYTFACWFQGALLPRRFAVDIDDPR